MNTIEHSIGGLYRPDFEKDSCGFGLIAQMDNKPSNWLIQTAINSLSRLTHRGAIAADGKSGDGCGLLIKKPDAFLRNIGQQQGFSLKDIYAIGMIFLHPDAAKAQQARARMEQYIQGEGLECLGWRKVPVDASALGQQALDSQPVIEQVFVNAADGQSAEQFERRLFIVKRLSEKAMVDDEVFYISSLSSQVVSYKGLVMPEYLPVFYQDLKDENFSSSLCVYHQRFSTNTLPQWRLAQPFRFLAHNGEINTIQGNRNWSVARAYKFQTDNMPDFEKAFPLVSMTGSDSSSLDNMLEALLAGGMDLFRAMRLLMPPAWQNVDIMDPDLQAFYEYNSMHMEPWDGPAGIVMTDGRYAACAMDRNGLRPARYVMTKDRHITLASEIGVYDYAEDDVVLKGRLGPGQMVAVDTQTGKLLLSEDIDRQLKESNPYRKWLDEHATRLPTDQKQENQQLDSLKMDKDSIAQYQKLFQLSFEERDQVLRPLVENSQEAVGSMGDDTPFPVLSTKVRSPYDYFRQQFAQVTNPPIDPLREQIVMSLRTCIGAECNVFDVKADHARRVEVDSPILSSSKFNALITTQNQRYGHRRFDLHYAVNSNLEDALKQLCVDAEQAVRDGKVMLVLSDRDIQANKVPIHALLATGAVHHHLIKAGLRCDANIIVETATARDSHHFATLIGNGATAIYPYLSYAVLMDMDDNGEIISRGNGVALTRHYRKGINKGLYKILSKMGISTVTSYRGAQLFEAVGLHQEVIDLCFAGTVTRIAGARFEHFDAEQRQLLKFAFNQRKKIPQGGLLKYIHGEEYHAYNPDVIRCLQDAVQQSDYEKYKEYAALVNGRPVTVLRDLLKLKKAQAISIEEVEPIEAIMHRFDSAGMSLGALSPEAHESLAIAMNRLGGRSNSGEGGEDPKRYGTERRSKIKQVASGRFGVTPAYLRSAEVLQIKVAQGAKPGEGGQLPGDKVNELIATLRYARPGVALISPPPHHDIYSIEDLAQLIFDLKQVNPKALVSVKLVAEAGVGTIAAGVAKAYADLITIAGYDGGTGASPLTSVKYAGSPWELGLTETHQVLRANDLRDKIRLQTDGGLKTGLDVIKAGILGAESFGFGTGPMVALGCKYLRICHLNNCATGVATQNDTLRKVHFIGLPEMVMNYFKFIAMETREIMAQLGIRKFDELIGQTQLLDTDEPRTEKQQSLDLAPILDKSKVAADKPNFCQVPFNEPFDKGELAEQMVKDALDMIENKTGGELHYAVRNTHRSIGARLSGEIAVRHGNLAMEEHPLKVYLKGTVGQSLGVWNAGGLHLYLEGDANDYVGKGMAGGKLVLHQAKNSQLETRSTPIMGNTCLYGATGGTLYAAGTAGERFAVRNSGCHAVVEGVGDHGCEYMTGGVVVVLGDTGINFGAGMTGGFCFVLDLNHTFAERYNHELVDIHRITGDETDSHRKYLRSMVEKFVAETGSAWGQSLVNDFSKYQSLFWLVKPKAAGIDNLIEMLTSAA